MSADIKSHYKSIRDWYKKCGYSILHNELKLQKIHKRLNVKGGNMEDEYPEQLMAVSYIQPNAKVLELGANIGRNTMVIATILDDDRNLITVETDPDNVKILEVNKEINGFNFIIEPSAISKKRLIQNNNAWITRPIEDNVETIPYGYKLVNTIKWHEFLNKYNDFKPDTLVADCEGAIYYILNDFPDFLDNINTIIFENDFLDISHEIFFFDFVTKKGFKVVYSKALDWNSMDKQLFYIVFKKEVIN